MNVLKKDQTNIPVMDLKASWLKNPDPFLRAFVKNLMTWYLGRELVYSDRVVINDILEQTKAKGYRFQDILNALFTHDIFLEALKDNMYIYRRQFLKTSTALIGLPYLPSLMGDPKQKRHSFVGINLTLGLLADSFFLKSQGQITH